MWQSLSAREGRSAVPEGPFDGVPAWLRVSLWTWVTDALNPSGGQSIPEVVEGAQLALHRDLGFERMVDPVMSGGYGGRDLLEPLRVVCWGDAELFLDVVDYLLARVVPVSWGADGYLALDHLLTRSGSVYRVAVDTNEGGAHLERRVAAEARADAERAMAEGDRAGEHLRRAWRAVYGRDPHPNAGYQEAVAAVEVAARPVVTPTDAKATLGKMIDALRVKPAKWAVDLDHPDGEAPVRAFADLLHVLWKGQHRHGDVAKAVEVPLRQAESAVQIAVLAVQWLRDGTIHPADGAGATGGAGS